MWVRVGAVLALLVLAGCATPTQSPDPVKARDSPAEASNEADSGAVPWDHAGDGQPLQVDAATPKAGDIWTALRHAQPGDPLGVARWDGFPAGAEGYPGTRDGSTKTTVLLAPWTLTHMTGAVVLKENGPNAVRAEHDAPVQLIEPSGDLHRLTEQRYLCQTEPCDLGTDTYLEVRGWDTRHPDLPADACVGIPEQFPEALAFPFPLRPRQSWQGDVYGTFGIPVHQSAEVVGLSKLPGWADPVVHIRLQQESISDCHASAAMSSMLYQPDGWPPLIAFHLQMTAVVDAYYAPAVGHLVLATTEAQFQSRATFNAASGQFESYRQQEPTAAATHVERNGTYTEKTVWSRSRNPGVTGRYEDAMRTLNAGKQLLPTGSKMYKHLEVAVTPRASHAQLGEPLPTFNATWSSGPDAWDWPAPELPSGVSWAWSTVPDWRVAGSPGGPSHQPSSTIAGSQLLRPQLVAAGSPIAWADIPLLIDAVGKFTATCPVQLQPPWYSTCGTTTFDWEGPVRSIYVNATGPPTVPGLPSGSVWVTSPGGGQTWRASPDANGRASLKIDDTWGDGTWTIGWDGLATGHVGQSVSVEYAAIAGACQICG